MNRAERILSNRSLKNRKSLSRNQPSINFMQEGEEVFYINKSRRRSPVLNLYRKQNGRLWSCRFLDESFKGQGGIPKDPEKPMRTSFNSIGIGSQEVPSKLTITDTKDTVFSDRVKASDFDILLKNKINRENAFSGIAFDPAKGSERNGVGACIAGLSDNTATDLHDTNLIFATNDGNVDGLTERVRITHDGRVGIGELDPSMLLHAKVADGDDNTYVAQFENEDTNDPEGIFVWFTGIDLSSDDSTSTHYVTCADNNGIVCAIYGDGDIVNEDNSYTSDIRVKKDIADATNKLDDLLKLKVRNYKYKKPDGGDIAGKLGEKRIGFIADELETVFPNLIVKRKEKKFGIDYDDFKTIRGSALVPILVKAVQELSAKVTALEN